MATDTARNIEWIEANGDGAPRRERSDCRPPQASSYSRDVAEERRAKITRLRLVRFHVVSTSQGHSHEVKLGTAMFGSELQSLIGSSVREHC